MSDSSDRPFGHATLKLRAVFVPGGAEHQVSSGDIMRSVGYGATKVGAVFVPEGGQPPGPPFVRMGRAQFRPDGNETASRIWSGRPTPPQPQTGPGGDEQESVPPPPPTPALGRGTGPSRAGLAAWRSVTPPGALRQGLALARGVSGTKRAPPGASDPSPDAPQSG